MGKMCLGLGKKLSVVGKKWKIGGKKINSLGAWPSMACAFNITARKSNGNFRFTNFGKKHFSSSVIQQILIRHAMPDYKKTPETRKIKKNWS